MAPLKPRAMLGPTPLPWAISAETSSGLSVRRPWPRLRLPDLAARPRPRRGLRRCGPGRRRRPSRPR
eukprot:3269069-Pyramimonas_sp.AAC.1